MAEKKIKKVALKKESPPVMKQCPRDPSHVWMADIPFCPYCNCSPEARIHYAQGHKDG
jgi:hypothetical protein